MELHDHLRREFLRLAGIGGGAIVASALPGCAGLGSGAARDFYFVQLTDTHWGYDNAAVNPEARSTLPRAVAAVNALDPQPDFVVFTGDLTQTTDDRKLRRARLAEVRDIAAGIRAPVRFFAGEHDAALDRGEAYQEFFGETLRYTFDHRSVHFIVLDNTSDPAPILGDGQLEWLRADLARLAREQPIVVLTHRPLFALHPQWDWATRDGDKAIGMLSAFPNVAVFYGHIHHEHHHETGHIGHHAAMSTMFPLSPKGTAEKKTQLPWRADQPLAGLGWRTVQRSGGALRMSERPLGARA